MSENINIFSKLLLLVKRGGDMPIRGFLSRDKHEEYSEFDYIEVDEDAIQTTGKGIKIKVKTLNELRDADDVIQELREGNIVFIRIKPLMEKDNYELKRAIDKIKKTCRALDGDIAGIDEGYVVVTPAGIMIHKGGS